MPGIAESGDGTARHQMAPRLRRRSRLRQVVATLQRNRADVERAVATMAPFVDAFANVTGNGRWFDSWVDGLLQPYLPKVN